MNMRLVATIAGAVALAAVSCASVGPARAADDDNAYRQLQLFGDAFERVREHYVEKPDDEKLIEAAINGMLQSLDPHSSYLNEDSFREMELQTHGEFGGVGIEVTLEQGLIKVVSPIDGTPAARAGIEAGDLITHIDGQPVRGLDLTDAVDRMRGPEGSDVELRIRRDKTDPFDVTLTREVITVESVRARVERGDVGYIRITGFTEQTQPGIERAIARLRAEAGEKLPGLVLDLRNNPGGLLDQAVGVADDFMDRGEIVSTRGREPEEIERYDATEGDLADGLPIVVLINGGSASASEIVAGALQDHDRALVVGTKSFGKGSVQTIQPIPGYGALRLTTAKYYTPSGRSIQQTGIEPDIVIEQARLEAIEEPRGLREDDLRNAIDNENSDDNEEPGGSGEPAADESPGPDGDETAEPGGPGDYQLARAIDLLRGIALYGGRPIN